MWPAESAMKIGGFQKNSLIDFPHTIACVIYTQGCNFICPYCHNPELIAGSHKRTGRLLDEKEIFTFLGKRKGLIQGVAITGGEPTLQKDLTAFCEKIKQMGFKIKMDTNGTCPKSIQELLERNLLSYIAMDIKTTPDRYHLVAPGLADISKITDSIQLIMDQAPDYEFRTTCLRPFVSKQIISKIGKITQGAKKYALQKCSRHDNILHPEILTSEDIFFSDAEMVELQNTIAPFVSSVLIR